MDNNLFGFFHCQPNVFFNAGTYENLATVSAFFPVD